jgi:amino acid transporter
LEGGHRGGEALSTELSLGLLGAFLIGISLAFEALEFPSQVAIVIGAALGFLFPALSTLVDFIGGTHDGRSPSLASEVENHEIILALESRCPAV